MIMKKNDKHVVTQIQSEENVKESFEKYPKPVYHGLLEDKLKPLLGELGEFIKGNPDKGIGALFLCGEMNNDGIISSRVILGSGSVIFSCLLRACEISTEFAMVLRAVVEELDSMNGIKNNSFNEN